MMSQSQALETKRQAMKRKGREYVHEFEKFEAKAREKTQDAVKTDEAGQQSFCELFEDLNAIQAAQSKDDNVGGGAAMVRGANAAVRMAQIGLKRSKNIAQGGSGFSVKDFIRNLRAKFPSAADENADGSTLDWLKNSKEAVEFFATTPTALCIAHPLGKSFEPKPRKTSVRHQRKDADEVRPLVNVEDTVTDERNGEKRKQQLFKLISSWKNGHQIPFAQLIIDPQSFGETCENMFACSFLVERNDLALVMDHNKRYMAQKVVHLSYQPKHETEDCVRDVIRMDWDLYESLVKEYYPEGKTQAKAYFKFDPKLPEA